MRGFNNYTYKCKFLCGTQSKINKEWVASDWCGYLGQPAERR